MSCAAVHRWRWSTPLEAGDVASATARAPASSRGEAAEVDEKAPPVPCHLAGAAKRIHGDKAADGYDPNDREARSDKPND